MCLHICISITWIGPKQWTLFTNDAQVQLDEACHGLLGCENISDVCDVVVILALTLELYV